MNTSTYRSNDGGKTFDAIRGAPGGDDYHALWIDPNDSVADDSRRRSRRHRQRGRRRDVEFVVQPADGAVLSRRRRQPFSVLGLRRAAGLGRGHAADAHEVHRHFERDFRPIDVGGESGEIAPDPKHPGLRYGGNVTDRTHRHRLGAKRRSDAHLSRHGLAQTRGRCRSSSRPSIKTRSTSATKHLSLARRRQNVDHRQPRSQPRRTKVRRPISTRRRSPTTTASSATASCTRSHRSRCAPALFGPGRMTATFG